MQTNKRYKILQKEYATFRSEITDYFADEVLVRSSSVLDPMAGTSPLIPYIEYLGVSAYFNDILPMHLIINKAKTYNTYCKVRELEVDKGISLESELYHCLSKLENKNLITSDKWIHEDVLEVLLEAWEKSKKYEKEISEFFQAIILLCVREYSCISPSDMNSTWNRPGGMTTEKSLKEILTECLSRFSRFYNYYYLGKKVRRGIIEFSADNIQSFSPNAKFDTIITSPVYPNRYDYVIAYAPEIYFLSKCESTPSIEDLRAKVHGTTVVMNYLNFDDDYSFVCTKSAITGEFLELIRNKQRPSESKSNYYFRFFTHYFSTLYSFLDRIITFLTPNGSFFLIVQNNIHRGVIIELEKYISAYFFNQGAKVDIVWYKDRGHQGRRNISKKYPLVVLKHRESIIRIRQ